MNVNTLDPHLRKFTGYSKTLSSKENALGLKLGSTNCRSSALPRKNEMLSRQKAWQRRHHFFLWKTLASMAPDVVS